MQKSAYLILGMHRSGTSALTGVLARLGVGMPKTTMPLSKDNPKGYYESIRIMQLNDALLQSLGSSWNDWRAVSSVTLADLSSSATLHEIMHTVLDEFDTDISIAIKDPRVCRIAPPWIATLQVRDYQPLIIIPYRSPLEVSSSLHARDGMGIEEGLLLWLRHMLDAEHYSRGYPRSFVLMSDLLQDWQTVMEGVAHDTNTQFPLSVSEIKTEMEDFLDPELKHFHADQNFSPADDRLRKWADGVFKSINALDKKQDTEGQQVYLDGIRERLNEAGELFSGLIYDIERKAELHKRDAQQGAAAQAELMCQLTLAQQAVNQQGLAGKEHLKTELAAQKAIHDALIEDNARTQEVNRNALIFRHDAAIDELKQKHAIEMVAQKAIHDAVVEGNARAHEGDMEALISRYDKTIDELKQKHAIELAAQKAAHDKLLKENAQTHEVDRNALMSRYDAMIDGIKQEHVSEILELKLSYDNIVSEKDRNYAERTDALNVVLNKYRQANITSLSKWALDKKSRP